MYAIIRDGGKQYRVEEGETLYLDLREAEPGDTIELTEVLGVGSGSDFQVGQPLVSGAKVVAEVVSEVKGPKLIYHHFRRRQGSRTRGGHRQRYTAVRINAIQN